MITVFTDASFYEKTGQAGWACWIKHAGLATGIFDGGTFKGVQITKAQEAELCAIAKGISRALKASDDGAIMVQSDCLVALERIRKAVPSVRISDHKNGAPILMLKRMKLSPVERVALTWIQKATEGRSLYLRHVYGHTSGAGRQWVNRECDRIAKQHAASSAPVTLGE